MFSESNRVKLKNLQESAYNDLFNNILPFWIKNTPDKTNGGFYGRISNDNKIIPRSDKSLILHSRILWTFSAATCYKAHNDYLEMAAYAYDYLINNFLDEKYGGMFWMLNYQGEVIDNSKKIYGQAFSIYALTEYYKVSQNINVLNLAKDIFQLIETNNYDQENSGYYEASYRNWSIANIALSEVDMNEVKSMNTHLHLMEAYINLFNVWPDPSLGKKLQSLVNNFLEHIIDNRKFQLKLFFDVLWQPKSSVVSFGHDIETSWLLTKAVDLLANDPLKQKVYNTARKMVDATINEGFNSNYLICSEKTTGDCINKNMDWWQQAEAVVGLINAFQITNDQKYLEYTIQCWNAVENYIINKEHGEWFYRILADRTADLDLFKVSEWKGPYHNGRTCLEIITRTRKILNINE